MKKVNLDKEFEKWKSENEMSLQSEFCHFQEDEFNKFVEEAWQEYQNNNGLIDVSNEITEEEVDNLQGLTTKEHTNLHKGKNYLSRSCDECHRGMSQAEYQRNKGLCDECVRKIQ